MKHFCNKILQQSQRQARTKMQIRQTNSLTTAFLLMNDPPSLAPVFRLKSQH